MTQKLQLNNFQFRDQKYSLIHRYEIQESKSLFFSPLVPDHFPIISDSQKF